MNGTKQHSGAYPYFRERTHAWREVGRYEHRDPPSAEESEAIESSSIARGALSDQGRIAIQAYAVAEPV